MRLSAAQVTVGGTKLGRTAFGANLRGGALALSIGEAQMYGGIAKVRSHRALDAVATSRRSSSSPTSTCRPAPTNCSASPSCPVAQSRRLAGGLGASPFGLASSLDAPRR